MKNDNIFKKGDRVFHFVFGWGSVTGDSEKGVCDVVFEDRKSVAIPCKEIHLSFCKYDLINGGLSHERSFNLEVEKSSGFDLDGILNENIICNDPESFTEAIKRLVSEKLEELEFEPFQKVLVRDGQSSAWSIDLFSYNTGSNDYPYKCLTTCWSQCIPYEGNEHLLGTSKSPEQ